MDNDEKQDGALPQLFEDRSQELLAASDAAAVARATQEIQASLVIAQRFPRNEVKAKAKILEACKRKGLAELAEYEYSRGGTKITGPTIDLLRAIASRWGNIIWGWSEVDRKPGMSMVRCWAWDTQSNGRSERTFAVKHWRDIKGGGYELEDERDIYELLANMASRRVRACLEEVIDSDIVADAIDQCRETLRTGEKTPLIDRVVKMIDAFKPFGVTQEMIEARIGSKAEACSENQLASLKRVYKSLRDGVGQVEDHFKGQTAAPDFSQKTPEKAPAGKPSKPDPKKGNDESFEAAMGLAPAQEKAPQTAEPPAQAAPEPPKPATEGERYLKAVRMLCKAGGISEGQLVSFIQSLGLSELGSLEEMAMSESAKLKSIHDRWTDILKRIKES